MRLVDRAAIISQPEGFIELITRQRGPIGRATGGTVVGAHIVGAEAGELIHEAVIAMQTRALHRTARPSRARLSLDVGRHPTGGAQLFADGRLHAPINEETDERP